MSAGFDRVARPYRWLEYLTFGPLLQRTRLYFLSQLTTQNRALVFGDGDGRFLARLLAANPGLHAEAIDGSARMLALLRQRCAPYATRLRTHHTDALIHQPAGQYDLIVTHFFLDCLTTAQIGQLATSLSPHLAPNAIWIVSDFCIPTNPLRLPAHLLVRGLYLGFRILTGLRTRHLPDHATALTSAGFRRIEWHTSCGGILFSERWSYLPNTVTST